MNELETLLRKHMEYTEKAPCCGTCEYYNEGSHDERGPGPGCTYNRSVRLFTNRTAYCKHYTLREITK